MSDGWKYFMAFIVLAMIVVPLTYFGATAKGRSEWNNYWHEVEKANENTSYTTRKQVEDTCRAMIASYNSDVMTYQQFKDYDADEQRAWAAQAKMRANKTANSYNNYILANSYIWKDNIPADICNELSIIGE